jgi:hypothetical protein
VIGAAGPVWAAHPPRAHAAYVVTCHNHNLVGGLAFVTSARNMSCAAAVREEEATLGHSFHSVQRTKDGFVCRPLDRRHHHWRCVKGDRAYRWEYGV